MRDKRGSQHLITPVEGGEMHRLILVKERLCLQGKQISFLKRWKNNKLNNLV